MRVFLDIIVVKKTPTSSPIYNHILVLGLEIRTMIMKEFVGQYLSQNCFLLQVGQKTVGQTMCQEWVWGEQRGQGVGYTEDIRLRGRERDLD